ncbi:tetratricopeptide repeat protein, partial [Myxococcota bacterium]|nr:tetratricopeptide repeat protein [Myxococcota bacterium]
MLFLVGFFTHLWTPCGAYGVKCVANLFEPPPPPPPTAPPPPPPKLADAEEIGRLIDEGSFEAFRSVLATVEKLGPTVPDNMLAAAKARGFAALTFGTKAFPLADLQKAVEGLNTIDLGKALGGNAAAANLEILKARAALDILNNAQDSAATQLSAALEARGDDKELAYLLGLARSKQGDHKGALEALDKAIVSDPTFAPALHAIGDALVALGGQPEDAATWYSKALAVEPAHTRSASAAASLYGQLSHQGQRRRTLAIAAEKVSRGLPPAQRAPFLYETALAYANADMLERGVSFATEAARLEPANTKFVALAAVALAEAGKPKDAQALLDPVLVREPQNVEVLMSRARVFIRMDDVAKAFIDLEAAKKLAPKDASVTLWEARFNVELAKLNDARESLDRSIKLGNATPLHYIELGRIDLTVGDVDAALTNANEAVKRDATSAAAHALLGDCYFSRGELEKALEEYRRGLELDDENVAANLGYANVLRDTGAKSAKLRTNVAEAIPIYLRVLATNPKNPTIMFEYGRALELQDDVMSALELYREAASLDEKDVRPHLKMAAAYIDKDDPDLKAASGSIQSARRIEAGTGRVNGHVRFWEGRLSLLERRLHDAEAALRSAVEAEPRNAIFHYWLGRALEENNSLYEAIGYYEKAVSLNSRLAVAHRALGRTALERNQFEKAREWFERYRESAPDDYSIWVDIGESYARQNLENDALEAFQKAVRYDPNNARALLQIGDIVLNK